MEIVDAHTNLLYPNERLPASTFSPWPSFQARLEVLREAGVSRAIACRNESVAGRSYDELSAWNRRIADACEASDGMLIPSAIIRPALGQQACDLLRCCRQELGMRFVGEMFDRALGYEWGTAEYRRVLECAIALRMVPLMHCKDGVATELGERYSDGRFLIAHLTRNPERRIAALAPYPSLYLLISGTDIAQAGQVRAACHSLGANRVVFGSDVGAVDPVIAVQCVRRSGLSESEQALVFAGNFWALWGWTESRGATHWELVLRVRAIRGMHENAEWGVSLPRLPMLTRPNASDASDPDILAAVVEARRPQTSGPWESADSACPPPAGFDPFRGTI